MMYRTNARPAALAVEHALRIVAPPVNVVEESDDHRASCVSDIEPTDDVLEPIRWKYFLALSVVTVTVVVVILIFAKPPS